MWEFALLAMEAAGMVFDYEGIKKQKKYNQMGYDLEQSAINANLATTRLNAEDASLQSLQNLRQTLGSQAAYFAASGGRTNAAFAQKSISAQGADERNRRINLMGQEAQLRAQSAIAKLNLNSANSKLDQDFYGRVFNAIPFSSLANMFSGGNTPNSAKSNASRTAGSIQPVARNFGQKPYRG